MRRKLKRTLLGGCVIYSALVTALYIVIGISAKAESVLSPSIIYSLLAMSFLLAFADLLIEKRKSVSRVLLLYVFDIIIVMGIFGIVKGYEDFEQFIGVMIVTVVLISTAVIPRCILNYGKSERNKNNKKYDEQFK